MISYQAFRYELDPTNKQRTLLAKHAGCARFAYNWGLARRIERYRQTGSSPNAVELNRQLNRLKPSEFPWMYEVSKCAPQEALRDLDMAFKRFFRESKLAKAENRRPRVGFPRFKKKGHSRDSFRLTGHVSPSPRSIRLPRIGHLRTKEGTSKLRGRILAATVNRMADRWYVSLRVAVNVARSDARTGPAVGIDLGIRAFAVISDEPAAVIGPKAMARGLKKQQRLARALSRKQPVSVNRRKAVMRIARHHRRVANVRRDFLHKLSTRLARAKPVIVIERLNVAGMLGNRRLARRIADAGWGEFRRQLEYKCRRLGSQVHRAPLFFPSSKTCSSCGAIKPTLSLNERTYRCDSCGLHIDRDRNAALNLAQLVAVSSTETLIACGEEIRPARRRPSSTKQEPSSDSNAAVA